MPIGDLDVPVIGNKQGRIVIRFAVDCTRKASIRVGTVCDPCKRRRRERRQYRYA